MIEWIAQLVGVCGMLLVVLSFQQNERKNIRLLQMIASVVWTVHFGMLGAFSGMAMNAIGIARGFVFSKKEAPWASKPFWPYLFSALSVVCCLLTWENWFSLLPTVAMVVSNFGLWSDKPKITRRLFLPCSLLWMVYNFANRSWSGFLTECFNTTSILVGMIRFDRTKKENS